MGLPFQNVHLSREFSSGMNQKNVYHLHNRNFGEFVVNGKQPWCHNKSRALTSWQLISHAFLISQTPKNFGNVGFFLS